MRNDIPCVDIIILSWNRVDSTIETIKNVLNQKNILSEIWLIDQGSLPEEIQRLRSYVVDIPTIHLIENGKNLGVPAGRNLGMRMGCAPFIFCIDNDAVFESEYAIESSTNKFRENPLVAILGFRINLFCTGLLDLSSWVYPKPLIEESDKEFLATRYCGAGHAIRRKCLDQTSFYDETLFFYWEELDLSYQLIELGYTILYYPTVTILHKISTTNKISWTGERFYFLVRNALYLNWKYCRSKFQFTLRGFGYLLKGLRNGIPSIAWNGIKDALRMCSLPEVSRTKKLSKKSRDYILRYDNKKRGDFINRLATEVFGKLPSQKR